MRDSSAIKRPCKIIAGQKRSKIPNTPPITAIKNVRRRAWERDSFHQNRTMVHLLKACACESFCTP